MARALLTPSRESVALRLFAALRLECSALQAFPEEFAQQLDLPPLVAARHHDFASRDLPRWGNQSESVITAPSCLNVRGRRLGSARAKRELYPLFYDMIICTQNHPPAEWTAVVGDTHVGGRWQNASRARQVMTGARVRVDEHSATVAARCGKMGFARRITPDALAALWVGAGRGGSSLAP
jgi:hypothetical protein